MLAPYWKKIGFGFAATTVVTIIALEYFFNLTETTKAPFQIALILIIVGLFIPVISREKQEDEMLKFVRRNALIRAFIMGILFYIFMTVANLFFNWHGTDAGGIIIWQLGMYHVYFYYLKKDIAKDKPEMI